MEIKNKFIIEGPPGVGKSTLLLGLALFAEDLHLPYFAISTPEIREANRRVGFNIRSIIYRPDLAHEDPDSSNAYQIQHNSEKVTNKSIEEGIFAHSKQVLSEVKVGKYYIDIGIIEKVAVNSLRQALREDAIRVFFIDGIGNRQLASENYFATLQNLLDSSKLVFVTIENNVDTTILDNIFAHDKVDHFYFTAENREAVLNLFIDHLVDIASS